MELEIIKRHRISPCAKCGIKFQFRKLKKLNEGFFCGKCASEKRKEHREYLKREVVGMRKREDILREFAERRKEKEQRIFYVQKPRERIPSLKSIKPKISLARGIYLTKIEKLVLYKKYVSYGLDSYDAGEKVKNCVNFLNNLVLELREKGKSEEEINKRFKEEFAKMVVQNSE